MLVHQFVFFFPRKKFDEYLIHKGSFHILNSVYLSVHLPTFALVEIYGMESLKNILTGLGNISYSNKMICEVLKKTMCIIELKIYGNCSCNGIYLERKLSLLLLKKCLLANKPKIKVQKWDFISGKCDHSVTICNDAYLWVFIQLNNLWSTVLLSFLLHSVCRLKA